MAAASAIAEGGAASLLVQVGRIYADRGVASIGIPVMEGGRRVGWFKQVVELELLAPAAVPDDPRLR